MMDCVRQSEQEGAMGMIPVARKAFCEGRSFLLADTRRSCAIEFYPKSY
jgi:hypothetical protein